MTTEARRIAIVGAGIGGLTLAARLAHEGHLVTVFEKNAEPGGRCGRLQDSGYTWDLGPTILLMRDVVEGVFRDCGRDPKAYLELVQCDPNYRIHFADGSSLTFTPNLPAMRAELERLEKGSFRRYLEFLSFSRNNYDTAVEQLVSRPMDSVASYLDPRVLRAVLSVRAYRKLYPVLGGFFRDERLKRALSFQTMYLGISPYAAPATFSLLPYTELAMGIHFPRGGLYALPLALERLAKEQGAAFRYRTPVERIVAGEGLVEGVQLQDGSFERFDVVVANADLPYAYEKLIPEAAFPRAPKLAYTSSAFMLYLGVDRTYEQLEHHNVVLGARYEETFREIFEAKEIPADPSFYVNRPSKTDPSLAPAGCDALYVLVPVPHQTPTVDWKSAAPLLRERILSLMETRLGMSDLRERIRVEHQLTPDDWQTRFNLQHGAAFGLSHDFWQVGALRPATRDATFRNLYFVGASTQPGTGVPLVMLSARIVAERLRSEIAEIPRNAPVLPLYPPGESQREVA